MKELTLEITNKCLENCPWCSSWSNEHGGHLEIGLIKDTLRLYRKSCDIVRISGGEPTLHPDLPTILFHAKALNYKVILLTNGQHPIIPLTHYHTDEYWVHIINESSIQTTFILQQFQPVTMQVVLAKGNEKWIENAVHTSLAANIPVRLLKLQKQGRGIDCEPSDLITMTGDKGCDKDNKITITHDKLVVSCSALKYGECSIITML